MNDVNPKFVQQSNPIVIDTTATDTLLVEVDAATVSYVNATKSVEGYSPNILEEFGMIEYISGIYEYISIIVIIALTVEFFRNYRRDISRIFKTLESDYLIKRYLENSSLALEQLYSRVLLIVALSGSFLMYRVMPVEIFGKYTFLDDYRIPIFIITVLLLLWLNSVLFEVNKMFIYRKWGVVRQVVSLSRAHTLFHLIVILFAIAVSYIYPDNNFFLPKIVALSGLVLVFIYTFIVSCKFFYHKNVSFFQYILYFCTVKTVGILFFGYCIWVIFG